MFSSILWAPGGIFAFVISWRIIYVWMLKSTRAHQSPTGANPPLSIHLKKGARETHTQHRERKAASSRSPISRRLKTKRLRNAGVSFPELYSGARPLFNCYQLRKHGEVLSVPGCNETIFHTQDLARECTRWMHALLVNWGAHANVVRIQAAP